MVRREDGLPENISMAGIGVKRNPGVTLLWFTRRYEVMKVAAIPEAGAHAGLLFRLGRPFLTEWYCKGRPATREEILDSINGGIPLLYDANEKQGLGEEGKRVVDRQIAEALKLVPHGRPKAEREGIQRNRIRRALRDGQTAEELWEAEKAACISRQDDL